MTRRQCRRPGRHQPTGPFSSSSSNQTASTATTKLRKTAGLALDELIAADIDRNSEVWEKVVRKLTARQMPPKEDADGRRSATTTRSSRGWNRRSTLRPPETPNPGRTETFRRLNRTEYQNTIRDLLALEVDVASLLPPDESSHGFDNVTVADLSPTLLNRYVSAAQKISRLAVGTSSAIARVETRSAFAPMSRRTRTSRACRSARAAAR